MLKFNTTMTAPETVTVREEDAATHILKTLVRYLTWSRLRQAADDEPDPLDLDAVSSMLQRLTGTQKEVLYNATDTRSEQELIDVLNTTIMRPRQFEVTLME
ncbi:unnamed protein product, partial [Candidula unifasciata]